MAFLAQYLNNDVTKSY